MIRDLVILALIVTTFAGKIDFDDCGDGSNSPTSFEVAGCDESPCVVHKGKTYEFTFKFNSPVNAKDLAVSIKARVFGVWVPWLGTLNKICGEGITCPLVAGQSYTYKSTITIPRFAPTISTKIQCSLMNTATDRKIFCNRFAIRVSRN